MTIYDKDGHCSLPSLSGPRKGLVTEMTQAFAISLLLPTLTRLFASGAPLDTPNQLLTTDGRAWN